MPNLLTLRVSPMAHFASWVSVASQTDIWVGPQLLQRPGGPRRQWPNFPSQSSIDGVPWQAKWVHFHCFVIPGSSHNAHQQDRKRNYNRFAEWNIVQQLRSTNFSYCPWHLSPKYIPFTCTWVCCLLWTISSLRTGTIPSCLLLNTVHLWVSQN